MKQSRIKKGKDVTDYVWVVDVLFGFVLLLGPPNIFFICKLVNRV